jgi:hypothetical protein
MAKFKPAAKAKGKDVPKKVQAQKLIPCLILVIGGIVLFSMFFYAFIKSAQ